MYNSIKKYSFRLYKFYTSETNFYIIRLYCARATIKKSIFKIGLLVRLI